MNKKIKSFSPLVSIVIPVYNGSKYVKEAIDSALLQTYRNIEVIVINDGSTDNTHKIVKSYGNRVRYFEKKNGGVSTALNLGIEKSKGKYISWLSHDDVYYPNKLEKQIEELNKLPSKERDVYILMSNYSIIDANSEVKHEQHFENTHLLEKECFPLKPLLKALVGGCTLLIPKKCFLETGLFDEKLKATQDYDLWFKMFPKYKMIFLSDVLVKTRVHEEQGTKIIPKVNEECSRLWIKMVEGLTKKDMCAIGGSEIGFLVDTYKLTKEAGYLEASEFIDKRLSGYRNRDVSKIKVSVIIPFFNRIHWTIEAIKSVIDQTHNNLEILLVDDASTDSVAEIRKLIMGDKRIRYFRNKTNKGVSFSRNFAISKAKGEYIAFLDSDDIFLKDKLKMQLSYMVKNALSFSYTPYIKFGRVGVQKSIQYLPENYIYPSIVSDCGVATPTVMLSTDIFFNSQLRFPIGQKISEDICLWIMISKLFPLINFNKILVKVRIRSGQEISLRHVQGLSMINYFVLSNSTDTISLPYVKFNNIVSNRNLSEMYSMKTTPIERLYFRFYDVTSEQKLLDKIYVLPIVGHLFVRLYLRLKKILKSEN